MNARPSGSHEILAVDPTTGLTHRFQTDGEAIESGASGLVYVARQMPQGDDASAEDARRVALKISTAPKWQGHLADEARLLHKLQAEMDEILARSRTATWRPVRIHSGSEPWKVVDTYGSALLVLEYLDGPTLRTWLEETWFQGPPPPAGEIQNVVLQVAQQLADALVQLACGGNVLHRDVKPDNLIRTSLGLRLLDFNVSRPDDDVDKTQYVGTERYRAPEVERGGRYGAAADLFGVGVILWEIAHRRRFDPFQDALRGGANFELKWPTSTVAGWPPDTAEPVRELLTSLVIDEPRRIAKATVLRDLVRRLDAPKAPSTAVADPLADHDMIGLLFELGPGALASVVTDAAGRVPHEELQTFLRERMSVSDPLEDWLVREVTAAATARQGGPKLFVLAGNAGDGKSHLIRRLLRERLADRPHVLGRIRYIADATQSLSPDESQSQRLAEFFAPFADGAVGGDDRVHLIAMNTGMVIRFFDQEDQTRFRGLYAELQRQLGLVRGAGASGPLRDRVEVVNLDLRDLLAPIGPAGESFAERLLSKLDPENAQGLTAPKWTECQACPAFALCPVAFNLRALKMAQPRKGVLAALRRAALDTDVHLSPRNTWAFVYRLVTGGTERYRSHLLAEGRGPCDVVREKVRHGDGSWLLDGHFTEVLFRSPEALGPWVPLARHDPAYSSAPELDRLHTRLGIKTELDNSPEVVAQLGGEGRTLAGTPLDVLMAQLPEARGRRRDAAVRRQAMFDPKAYQAWQGQDGSRAFSELLEAYDARSHAGDDVGRLSEAHRKGLQRIRELVQGVFLHGHGREVNGTSYLRVSQPNARGKNELLVRAGAQALNGIFNTLQLVKPDLHVRAHEGRVELLRLLGYRPAQVTVEVAGIRLMVDLALHDFLVRVSAGQKPSIRALAEFQALLFIGERIGNLLAKGESQGQRELFVWDGHALHRLATDDFGHPTMSPAP